MFMRFSRTNPTKAIFAFSAAVMPEESTAATEAKMCKPTFAALKIRSLGTRPVMARKQEPKST